MPAPAGARAPRRTVDAADGRCGPGACSSDFHVSGVSISASVRGIALNLMMCRCHENVGLTVCAIKVDGH